MAVPQPEWGDAERAFSAGRQLGRTHAIRSADNLAAYVNTYGNGVTMDSAEVDADAPVFTNTEWDGGDVLQDEDIVAEPRGASSTTVGRVFSEDEIRGIVREESAKAVGGVMGHVMNKYNVAKDEQCLDK